MQNPNLLSILFQDQGFSTFEFDDVMPTLRIGGSRKVLKIWNTKISIFSNQTNLMIMKSFRFKLLTVLS